MMSEAARWQQRERDAVRRLLDLHERLDKLLTPGGLAADMVADAHLTKQDVAMLLAAIEASL